MDRHGEPTSTDERIARLLREALLESPSPATAVRHLTAMRTAAAVPARPSVRHRVRWAGAALAGALTVTGGLGVAGALPGATQGVVADLVSHVGVELPGSDEPVGDAPASPPVGAVTDDAATDGAGSPAPEGEHGATVVTVAQDPTLTGCDHGQAVAEVASDERSGGPDGEAACPETGDGTVAGTGDETDADTTGPPAGTPAEVADRQGHGQGSDAHSVDSVETDSTDVEADSTDGAGSDSEGGEPAQEESDQARRWE